MKKTHWIILCILMLGMDGQFAEAAMPPQFETFLSKNKIRVGETTLLTIQAKWPQSQDSWIFEFPDISTRNLTIVRKGESQEIYPQNGQPWVVKTLEIELQAQAPGEGTLRAFDLKYKSSVEPSPVETSPDQPLPPVTVPIQTYLVPGYVIQIDPQSSFSSYRFLGPVLLLLGVSGGCAILFFLFQKKKTKEKLKKETPLSREDFFIHRMMDLLQETHEKAPKDLLFESASQFRQFLNEHFCLSKNLSENDLSGKIKENFPAEEASVFHILDKLYKLKYSPDTISLYQFKEIHEKMTTYIKGKKIINQSTPSSS